MLPDKLPNRKTGILKLITVCTGRTFNSEVVNEWAYERRYFLLVDPVHGPLELSNRVGGTLQQLGMPENSDRGAYSGRISRRLMQLTLVVATKQICKAVGGVAYEILNEIVKIGRKTDISDRDTIHRASVYHLAKLVVLLRHDKPPCSISREARLKVAGSYLSVEKLDYARKESLRYGNRLINPRLVLDDRYLVIRSVVSRQTALFGSVESDSTLMHLQDAQEKVFLVVIDETFGSEVQQRETLFCKSSLGNERWCREGKRYGVRVARKSGSEVSSLAVLFR
jgi:hypothetical protein